MDWIQPLIANYGPLAFGVIVFLVIWHTVIKPERAVNREQSERSQEAMRRLLNEQATQGEVVRKMLDRMECQESHQFKLMEMMTEGLQSLQCVSHEVNQLKRGGS